MRHPHGLPRVDGAYRGPSRGHRSQSLTKNTTSHSEASTRRRSSRFQMVRRPCVTMAVSRSSAATQRVGPIHLMAVLRVHLAHRCAARHFQDKFGRLVPESRGPRVSRTLPRQTPVNTTGASDCRALGASIHVKILDWSALELYLLTPVGQLVAEDFGSKQEA